jgi:hypothetical protein
MQRALGRPHPAEIGEAREQSHAPLEAPQLRRDLLRSCCLCDRIGKCGARFPRMGLGIAREACGEICRSPLRQSGKIG